LLTELKRLRKKIYEFICVNTVHNRFSQLQQVGKMVVLVVIWHNNTSNLVLISREVMSSDSSLTGQNCFSTTQRCTTALTNGSTDSMSSDWHCCGVCTRAFSQSRTMRNDFL